MNGRDLAILHLLGAGQRDLRVLSEAFDTYEDFLCVTEGDLLSLKIKRETIKSLLQNRHRIVKERIWHEQQKWGIFYLGFTDEDYPSLLKEVKDAPGLLYGIGNALLLQNKMISMVGSRNISEAGLKKTYHIARGLSEEGITIVSGLAMGADGMAHLGAMEGMGKSIGILAGGVDIMYPKTNMPLYKTMIEDGGLILSESLPKKKPKPSDFPIRNRIVAGLAHGTIICEAEIGSGTMHTSNHVIRYERKLFVISPTISGRNKGGEELILDNGAIEIMDDEAVLASFLMNKSEICTHKDVNNTGIDETYVGVLTAEEEKIFRLFRENKKIHISEFDLEDRGIYMTLLQLELTGVIRKLPGSFYVKVRGE